MKHLPIIGKFLGIIALFALFVVGATYFATSKMRFIDDSYSNLSDHQGVASISMARGSRALWAARASIADLLISRTEEGNKAAQASFAEQRADFISSMDGSAAVLPDHAAQFAALKQKGLQVLDQTCAEAFRLGQSTDADTVLKSQVVFARDCSPAIKAVTAEVRTATDDLIKETKVINDATTDVTNATIYTTWALILGGLLIVMAGGIFAVRTWISKPLTVLATTMSGIAGGNYTLTVSGDERRDEIGTIARVAQVFKTTGTEKIALEAETARQRDAAEKARERDEEAQKQIAAQQAQVVDALATGLERLSDGDLVFRLQDRFAVDYEKLRTDFNAAMGKLQDTMGVIAGNTAAIRSGTLEISTAADDLSRRTEQQAASLEETAAALDEITATVRKTAEGATHARTVVSTAKSDAEQSSIVVGRAVEAMAGIEASSNQIGQIIGVIDEIAFQTNLLALNAGVEAARAGEAGRGFAVVASEVRALAQRSAEAAKEIKVLIAASAQHVGSGVELVGETGKSLQRIMAQVTEINAVVTDIAASAQEQSAGLDQVNTAINQMDQVTQQNAAMVEQSTAASKNLAQETEELAGLVGRFRVEDGAASGARRQTTRAVLSPVRSAASKRTAPAQKMVANGGPVGAGGDEWQEF